VVGRSGAKIVAKSAVLVVSTRFSTAC